ncbi:MAG: GxxExxY protein [Patescibacteria group bacterium]|nr:GxxExxY protein [Patescibacteria group bacterium]
MVYKIWIGIDVIKKEYPLSNLTEQIISCAFEVYNQLGYGLPEKVYQKALAKNLEDKNLLYDREKYSLIKFNSCPVGKFFLDFLVENKVAVELKVRNEIYETDMTQLLNYLKSEKLKIGLLLVFTNKGVKIKRLIN